MIQNKQAFASTMVLVKEVGEKKRNFIIINLQAVVDGYLQVITPAVNELHERATAAAIRKIL